jgi:hypothetical protein
LRPPLLSGLGLPSVTTAIRPGRTPCPDHEDRPAAEHYSGAVSTPATPDGEGFEVVVDPDGALRVLADELARHGVRPGAHLRLVHQPQPRVRRRRVRGALADVVDPATLDALEAALDEAKTERIAAVERRWT